MAASTAPPPSPMARVSLTVSGSESLGSSKPRDWELETARAEVARLKEALAQAQADAATARTEAATAQMASSAESAVAAVRTQSSREEVHDAVAAVRAAEADATAARAETSRVRAASAQAATAVRIQQEAQHKEYARLRAELEQITVDAATSVAELARVRSSSASLKDCAEHASEQERQLRRELESATATVADQTNQIESLSAELDANVAMISELRQKLEGVKGDGVQQIVTPPPTQAPENESRAALVADKQLRKQLQECFAEMARQQALRREVEDERDTLKQQVLELENWKTATVAQKAEEAEVLSSERNSSAPTTPARDVVAMQLAEENEVDSDTTASTLALFSVTFTETGSLGLRLKPHPTTGSVRVEAVVEGSQATHHPELKPELVIHSIDGEKIFGKTYSDGLAAVKAARRPVTIEFIEETAIAAGPTPGEAAAELSVTFTEAGSLGLKFTTTAPSSTNVQLAQINPGTQAESHPQLATALRLHNGELYLRRVAGVDMAGKTYREVLTVLRASRRPLTLTFAPGQLPHPGETTASPGTASRAFIHLDAERAREATMRRSAEQERDLLTKNLSHSETMRHIAEQERDALVVHKAKLTEELNAARETCAHEKNLRIAADEEKLVWAKRYHDAVADHAREEQRKIAVEEERISLQMRLEKLMKDADSDDAKQSSIVDTLEAVGDEGMSDDKTSTPYPLPEPEPEPQPQRVNDGDPVDSEREAKHDKVASNVQQHEHDVAEFLSQYSGADVDAGVRSSVGAQRVIQALRATVEDSAGWVSELAAMKNDGTIAEFLKACSSVGKIEMAAAEELVHQKEVKFECRHKGKKRQLRIAQMNVGLFDGQRPVSSWLYEKIEEWEFSTDNLVFSLVVHKSGPQDTDTVELKMATGEDGHLAMSAIQSMVMGLLEVKKQHARQEKKLREQSAVVTTIAKDVQKNAALADDNGNGRTRTTALESEASAISRVASSAGSAAGSSGRVTATSMMPQGVGLFDATLGSKSVQLQAGGMGLTVFSGGQPIETLLYTTLAGWQVIEMGTQTGLEIAKVDDTVSQHTQRHLILPGLTNSEVN